MFDLISLLLLLPLSLSKISRDPDLGWRKYPDGYEYAITDFCQDETCEVIDDINNITYYGPFKEGITYLARNFACIDDSIATINYKVVFCDTDNHGRKDFVFKTIKNMADNILLNPSSITGTKYKIDQTIISTTYDSNLIGVLQEGIAPSGGVCLNWALHELSDPINYNAYANAPFQVLFKFKLDDPDNFGYIFDIEVNCDKSDIGDETIILNDVHDSKVYCINGLPIDEETGFNPNGEYILRLNKTGEWIETNNEGAFEKNDPNGRSYLFEKTINNDQETWYISKQLNDINSNNLIASCKSGQDIHYDEIIRYCIGDNNINGKIYDINGDEIYDVTIESNGCNTYTTINSSLFGLFITDTNEIKVLTLLISLSILSCIVGMMTCYCFQLICTHHKNKNYKKVSNKDVDIDF